MDKEKLLKEFMETKIYLDERDGTCNFSNDLRRKYPEYIGILDFANIYRRIVNYRIAVFGTSTLFNPASYTYKTKEERIKDSHRAYIRKRKIKDERY